MNKNIGVVIGGLCLAGFAYAVLSRPDCRKACHSIFEPLASTGGQMALSGLIGLLGMAAVKAVA